MVAEGMLAESERGRQPPGPQSRRATARRWGIRELKWLLLVAAMLVAPRVGPRLLSLAAYNLGEVARVKAALGGADAGRSPALQAYQMAIAADRSNFLPYLGYGRWLLDRGDLAAAEPWLEQAVALRQTSRRARFYLGLAFLEQGQQERALAHLRQTDVRVSYLVHRAWQQILATREQAAPTRDWTAAERYYRAAVALVPEDPALWHYLTNFYLFWTRDYDQALVTLRAMADAIPTSPVPHQRAATLLWDHWHDAPGALAELEAAVRLAPGDVESYLQAASILSRSGNTAAAESWLRQAVAIAPENAEARFRLGDLYLSEQRAPQAIRELRAATKAAPEVATYQARLAEALQAMGLLADAIEAAERATALAPDVPEHQRLLGDLYRQAGQRDRAVSAYRRALTLAPDDSSVQEALQALEPARDGRP